MPPKTPQPWQFLVTPIRLTDLVVFFRESDVSRPLYLPYGTLLEILTAAINGGSGTSILLQTNSVDNPVQDVLNLIEGAGITITDDGAGGITFDVTGINSVDNGLSPKSGDPNVFQLGGVLVKDTDITNSGYYFRVTQNSGKPLELYSNDAEALLAQRANTSRNTIDTVLRIVRKSTTNPLGIWVQSGFGASVDFDLMKSNGDVVGAGQIAVRWNSPINPLESSVMTFSTRKATVLAVKMAIDSEGSFTLVEYGSGTFLGTPSYLLGVDGGDVIEVDPSTIGIQSINTLTASAQFIDTGTSGTAPAVVSATDTHTINIPLASVASVTEGTISNVEYEKFNSKWGTFISTQAASSSATIDFTGLDGTYKLYTLVIQGLISATNIVELWVRMGTGATPTWASGATDYVHTRSTGVGTSLAAAGTTDSKIVVQGATVGNASTNYFNGTIELWNPASATQHKSIRHDSCSFSSGGTYYTQGTGRYAATTAVTGIRILCSSGNITSGNFTLYGSL